MIAKPAAIVLALTLAAAGWAEASVPISVDAEFAYQGELRSTELLIEPDGIRKGIDLQRAYFSRPAFFRIGLEAGRAEGLWMALEGQLRPEWRWDWGMDSNLPWAGGGLSLENANIRRAVVGYRLEGLEISLGRDRVGYNDMLEGGFLPSARLPFQDALRATGSLGPFRLDYALASIPALRSSQGESFDVDPNKGLDAGNLGYGFEMDGSQAEASNPSAIIDSFYRLGFDFGKLRLGFSDHAVIVRRNNRFAVTDFLPIGPRHQSVLSEINLSMVIDLAWEPLPGISLAAQAGADDININFTGVADSDTPTIDAYAIGLSAYGESKAGTWSLYLEAGKTHWLWGNYDGTADRPYAVNPLARFTYRFAQYSGGALLLPLSSPYGPGVLWARGRGEIRPGEGRFSLGLEALGLSVNAEANLVDTPVIGNTTTESAPRVNALVLQAPLRFSQGRWVLEAVPEFLLREGEAALSVRIGASWAIRALASGKPERQASHANN
jgi:hypothetical protein